METKKLQELEAFASLLTKATEFNMLKPHPRLECYQSAELLFHGYHDLTLAIIDIIRVCSSALDALQDVPDSPTSASARSISDVLGIAVKLMPVEEIQILDNCYQKHLKLKAEKSLENEQADHQGE
ncbi:hypothetical protein GN157_16915 [Flavobacterium rakeshii]|uniref:Uncharacterized protein n=2 Tax=Flavobacterium rakeshii TaxID=1038845 RepID=A0A6N8HI19_9FLAO|nr:hypothetical protein [Flavobacterium rakeshii]